MTKNISKVSLFLSALAIALIALLLVYFKALQPWLNANAAELTSEESDLAISQIYDYIDSLNGFTDEQKNALDTIIRNYMDENQVITQDDLTAIYALIDEKYQSNRTYMENIKLELTKKIEAGSTIDNSRYEEIKKLIADIDIWLDDTSSKQEEYRKNLSALIQELRAYSDAEDGKLSAMIQSLSKSTEDEINDLNLSFTAQLNDLRTSLTTQVNDLRSYSDSKSTELESRIKHLEELTSDNGKEFDFRYENGTYGFYDEDGSFRPF